MNNNEIFCGVNFKCGYENSKFDARFNLKLSFVNIVSLK